MRFLLLVTFFSFVTSVFADGEKVSLRWKFKRGGRFEYSLYVTVMEEKGGKRIEKRLRGVIVITGVDEKNAIFLRRYDELRWREGKISYYTPATELQQLTVRFRFKRDGSVTEGDAKERVEESLKALFPLPPRSVSEGDVWGVELGSFGVMGSCEFRGYEKRDERNCALLMLTCSRTPENSEQAEKEMETKAYFDREEGCFVYVERRLKERTDGLREELLTLTLTASPSRPSRKVLMENLVGELRSRLTLSPTDSEMRKRLIRLLMGMGRYQEALKEVEAAVNLKPTAEFYSLGGECTLALGDGARAIVFFKKALEKEPDSKEALLGASRASFLLKRFRDALSYARRSFGGGRGPFEALYYIGASLAKLNRRAEAEEMLRAYIKANPNLDESKKWLITFTEDGDVKILAERKYKGDIAKRTGYTEDELKMARQLLAVVVKEESVRMRLSADEIEKMLEYMASIYGKKVEEMLSDFLVDRVQTSRRLREALDERVRVYEEGIEALDLSEWDGAFSAAALSLVSGPDVLDRYLKLKKEKPGVVEIHLELLRLYFTNPVRFKKEILSTLHFLKNMEPDNAAYSLLEAWLSYRLKNQVKALDCIGKGALCRTFSTHKLRMAKKRREVLEFLNYPADLLNGVAWTARRNWMERPIKEALQATALIAKRFCDDGRFEKANELALLLHRTSVLVGAKTASALLFCAAVGFQETALSILLRVAENRNEEEKSKRLSELLEAAKKRSRELLDMYQRFLFRCEKAFTVWWITEPKKYSTFTEQLFKIGEKRLLLRSDAEKGGK